MLRNTIPLIIIFSSIFGAGIVDVVFPDVVPIRPYDIFFITQLHNPVNSIGNITTTDFILATLIVLTVVIMVFFPKILTFIPLATRKVHTQHKDYYPIRSSTQILEQINEPLEKYSERKLKAFKELLIQRGLRKC